MHTYTHKLSRRTAQQVPARRPGITTGFLPGKKLPHVALSGCNQPHEAYNPVGIHQMAPPEHTWLQLKGLGLGLSLKVEDPDAEVPSGKPTF